MNCHCCGFFQNFIIGIKVQRKSWEKCFVLCVVEENAKSSLFIDTLYLLVTLVRGF